jgi:hypothetical protein
MPDLLSCFVLISIIVSVSAARGQQPAQSRKQLTIAQVWTLDATYKDAEHGVTFRYPSVWEADTQLAYNPPALSIPADVKPVAGFAYELDGSLIRKIVAPYSRTSLEGFGIVYSVFAAGSAVRCRAYAATLAETPQMHTVLLANRTFWRYETSTYGMMQSTSGWLYATYTNRLCYLFETDVAVGSIEGIENARELTSDESRSIDLHLFSVMKSVRIETR